MVANPNERHATIATECIEVDPKLMKRSTKERPFLPTPEINFVLKTNLRAGWKRIPAGIKALVDAVKDRRPEEARAGTCSYPALGPGSRSAQPGSVGCLQFLIRLIFLPNRTRPSTWCKIV